MRPKIPPETASHRYTLTRDLRSLLTTTTRRVLFCILNPSTATAHRNDQTVRKVVGFTTREDGNELTIVNVYAGRATDPAELAKMADPVGAGNDRVIEHEARRADLIVAAWECRRKAYPPTAPSVSSRLLTKHGNVYRLGKVTQGGHPQHPLYLPGTTRLELHAGKRQTATSTWSKRTGNQRLPQG